MCMSVYVCICMNRCVRICMYVADTILRAGGGFDLFLQCRERRRATSKETPHAVSELDGREGSAECERSPVFL